MPEPILPYDSLPQVLRDNVDAEQWEAMQHLVIRPGEPVPDTTGYLNLKNGQISTYERGTPAAGHLLAEHNLAGARGGDSQQFEGAPPGAHPAPRR
jgi:hypothetical protein